MTAPAQPAPAADDVPPRAAQPSPGVSAEAEAAGAAEGSEGMEGMEERTQEARAAQRELFAHTPGFILGSAASFGGSLVGGAQHGVSGGQVAGDVFMGGKTEIHHHAPTAAAHVAGEIPREQLDALAERFAEGPVFAAALARLREERVLVLAGPHGCGRHAAARMLLHRLGLPAVHALSEETTPGTLSAQLTRPGGHLLRDLPLTRNRPLRDTHLYAAADQLRKADGYLVVTVEKSPFLSGVSPFAWRPPAAEDVVRAHLAAVRPDDTARLLALGPVRDFLARGGHRPAEAAGFAATLAGYDGSPAADARLVDFGQAAVEKQCRDRLGDTRTDLRDKAFLISLAVFDRAPYVLAAELADKLLVHLQRLQHPERPPEIPVFSPLAAETRLERAGAKGEVRGEETEWGTVPQFTAYFPREDTPRALLAEVWTGHPSARPALVAWLKELARDRRPLVRTRVAAATALLARADLPSAVALIIDGWAVSKAFGPRVTAANALVLAQLLDAPVVLRLLTQWCTDPHWARRWTAIRALGLLAPLRPELTGPALGALAARARADHSGPAESANLIESTALLLSVGTRRGEMLSELVRLLQEDAPSVRSLALAAFVRACENTEEGALVEWYADTGMYEPDSAHDLATLWRTALGDRGHTRQALNALRVWVYTAQRSAATAQALELLLPALVVTAADRHRLDHELRTLRAEDGGPRPPVADRLLAVVSPSMNPQQQPRS
ncbi:hypothetical protein [Streptomyces sp. JB150]|uniref:hypothetical protein n=1 Tax=Streptomyces sp. JB150 TaxID=2714844 RepID=UPI00140BC268|nr:hypothetical protein [Streptomyces sp. JB150]QIJ64188.1 hypothetical protein G7Z13_20890 [Streptomyces sp. JB150]